MTAEGTGGALAPVPALERIADYELVRPLGSGNNGTFHLARPPERLGLDVEYVTVKVLDGPTPADTFRRASRELRAFAAVRSEHLVALHDAGQDGERIFYSMEYVEGGSLAVEPRPREEILRAVADAARAAHALHEHGLAHRGIQPATVMVTPTGGKLADLGLAHRLDGDIAATVVGDLASVGYIDPGILLGAAPSRASDIWSLGLTLHRALAGVGVHVGEAGAALGDVRRMLSGTITIAPDLDPAVAAVVTKSTAPDPADRHRTAAEFAAEVDALVG